MEYISDPKRHKILKLLLASSGTQFVIPVYQRNYVWEANKQVKTLLDDIKFLLEEEYKSHFIGIIIYLAAGIGNTSNRKFYVIDGQQRLTTIFLILLAIKHIALELKEEDFAKEIKNLYLTNPYVKNDKIKMKLKPLMRDSDVYEKIADNKIDKLSKTDRESNVAKSYFYIKKYIKELNTLYSLEDIKNAINKLYLVDFPLGPDDNAHQIYESINAKGSKLLSIDLIRNFVLMNSGVLKQEEVFEELWLPIEEKFKTAMKFENFFRFFLMNKSRSMVSKKNIYPEFQNWFFNRKNLFTVKEILFEIEEFSNYYIELYEQSLEKLDIEIRLVVRELRQLNSDMTIPFLLEIYSLYIKKTISADEFNSICNIIISYIIRRTIIGLGTSSLSKVFSELIRNVENNMQNLSINYIDAVKVALVDNHINLPRRMPTDEELLESLQNFNVYKGARHALKIVFHKIENHENDIYIDTSKLEIEHLLPQSYERWLGEEFHMSGEDYEKHLNKIGNLTLTSKRDNAKMSNNLFDYKKEILKHTNHLRMNLEIFDLENWTIEEIDKRTRKITNQIIDLYPYYLSKHNVRPTNKKNRKLPLKLPLMKTLFKYKVLNKGDLIYLRFAPSISEAKVIDDKEVEFKEERISYNNWGKKLSGWKSINIYDHIIIKKGNKALQEERIKLYKNINDFTEKNFIGIISENKIEFRRQFLEWLKSKHPQISRPEILASDAIHSINNKIGFSINDLIKGDINIEEYQKKYVDYFESIGRSSPKTDANNQKRNALLLMEFLEYENKK